ncbi:bifunctional riboflavin kinase/FAD synthetase [Planctomicrobium sp. SH668]|uniref:bifunctional riboflavin kinase/FAD synthetase n=1 Tax=Planctomicrobium sp. SH668 TaxID=3448126 RepID=UPI003F5CAF12
MNSLAFIEGLDPNLGCVLSIGNFDGIHRGHQHILQQLMEKSARLNVPSVVMTFDPHPAILLNPETPPPPRLTTSHQKIRRMQELGIDRVVVYPTTPELLQLTPREFFDRVVIGQFQARGMVEGPNFYFGKDRTGNDAVLKQLCEEAGCELTIVDLQTQGESLVSSSMIRRALSSGDVAAAAEFLGRPHSIEGVVRYGAQRGRTIGFPTANIENVDNMVPVDGVYGCRVLTGSGSHLAAVSIGPNPTFSDGRRKIEVHLLDFSGDLYGQYLVVEFLNFVRGLKKFESAEELQHQIKSDVALIRGQFEQPSVDA